MSFCGNLDNLGNNTNITNTTTTSNNLNMQIFAQWQCKDKMGNKGCTKGC